MALGSLWVRRDSVILLEKNDFFYQSDVVDKAGLPYDAGAARQQLLDWNVGDVMSIPEFKLKSAAFERIGDVPAAHRKNCRFVMNYYIDVTEETFEIFQNVFSEIFFSG